MPAAAKRTWLCVYHIESLFLNNSVSLEIAPNQIYYKSAGRVVNDQSARRSTAILQSADPGHELLYRLNAMIAVNPARLRITTLRMFNLSTSKVQPASHRPRSVYHGFVTPSGIPDF